MSNKKRLRGNLFCQDIEALKCLIWNKIFPLHGVQNMIFKKAHLIWAKNRHFYCGVEKYIMDIVY